MQKRKLEIGDLVQLNPDLVGSKAFADCIMIVTEPKEWGAQGYVQMVGEKNNVQGDKIFYRAEWREMEFVGHINWIAE